VNVPGDPVTPTSPVPRANPNANGDDQLNEPMQGQHPPDPLSDRKAGGLLLAFVAAVVVVLAVATLPMLTTASGSIQESTGGNQLDRSPR